MLSLLTALHQSSTTAVPLILRANHKCFLLEGHQATTDGHWAIRYTTSLHRYRTRWPRQQAKELRLYIDLLSVCPKFSSDTTL